MINPVYYCDREHKTLKVDDIQDISELVTNKKNLLWIDLLDPTDQELQNIAEEFNFHHLAVEDAHSEHQRPKVDEYDDFYFVVFYSLQLNPDGGGVINHELDMFMGQNYLVTVHNKEIPALKEAGHRWEKNSSIMENDIGLLVYSILDTLVDNYFPVLDEIVERVEKIEDAIFNPKKNQAPRNYNSQILDLKRNLIMLRRVAAPERDVINILSRRDNPILSEKTRIYFQDVYDHLVRVTDAADNYRDFLNSAVDANLAVISNDLNKVMRTLTATSIILMTNALIAGIYGMNFENIPELKWQYGYFYCLGLMLTVSVGLYYFFKRKNWF